MKRIIFAILLFHLTLPSSWAQTSAANWPAESEFDNICKSALGANPQTAALTAAPGSKASYCAEADSARQSATAARAGAGIWAGVAGVCMTACVLSMAGIYSNEVVCQGVNFAGMTADTVVTGVLTRNLSESLTNLAMNATFSMPSLISAHMQRNAAQKAAKEAAAAGEAAAKPQKDVTACITAATATIQATVKGISIDGYVKTTRQALANAKSLGSGNPTTGSVNLNSGTGAEATANSPGGEAPRSATAPIPYNQACTGGHASVECAFSTMGENVVAFAQTPEFSQNLQEITGSDLGSLVAKDEPIAAMLGETLGPNLSPEQLPALAETLQNVQTQLEGMPPESLAAASNTYSKGGAAPKSARNDDDKMMQNMMAGLMEKLMPKTGETAPQSAGLVAVIQANKKNASTVAEDRKLSIFDRITYRYFIVGMKWAKGGITK